MDCVYHAFKDHLTYLGIPYSKDGLYSLYRMVKKDFHKDLNEPSSGVVAVDLARMIEIQARPIDLPYKIQCHLWTREYYREHLKKEIQQWHIDRLNFGEEVRQVTLEPAIYLNLSTQHAYFDTRVPKSGVIIMAIQFYSPDKNLYTKRRELSWKIRTLLKSQLGR